MEPFTSILVDVDATAAVHPALDRAVQLARRCGARLTIVDVVNIPADAASYVSPALEQTLIGSRRERLAQFARSATGVAADVDVLRGRPATALVREVLRAGHDLLIRSHARDVAVGRRKPYGAIDMQLFRECPCPVWAIGPDVGTGPPRILAAVHATADDEAENRLNRKVIELALLMTRLEQGSLGLLQAWTAYSEEVLRSHFSADDLAAYVEAAESTAGRNLTALVDSFGDRLAGVDIALPKGDPEDIIPQFVVSEGINLVIMGTVARTGVPGLLIGNTAERVLQRLLCSVMTVKPDGFVSPVLPDTVASAATRLTR